MPLDESKKKEFLEKIDKISSKELKQNLAHEIYGNPTDEKYRLVEIEIEEREKTENARIARENLHATRRLVFATWALVIITGIYYGYLIIKAIFSCC